MDTIEDKRRSYRFCVDDAVLDVFGPRIGAYGVAVYTLLARHAKQKECFPSYKLMQQKLGIGRMTVVRTLALLQKEGLITVKTRKSRVGDYDTKLYTLCDLSSFMGGGTCEVPPGLSEVPPGTCEGPGVVPVGYQGGTCEVPEGISFKDSQSEGSKTSPLLLPNGEKMSLTKKVRSKVRTDYSPGFLAMWDAYPHHSRSKKPSCFAIWLREDLEPRTAEIVEKVERLKVTTWKNKEPTYIPYTATWFNNGCWEDELVPLLTAVKPTMWGWAEELDREKAAHGSS